MRCAVEDSILVSAPRRVDSHSVSVFFFYPLQALLTVISSLYDVGDVCMYYLISADVTMAMIVKPGPVIDFFLANQNFPDPERPGWSKVMSSC